MTDRTDQINELTRHYAAKIGSDLTEIMAWLGTYVWDLVSYGVASGQTDTEIIDGIIKTWRDWEDDNDEDEEGPPPVPLDVTVALALLRLHEYR